MLDWAAITSAVSASAAHRSVMEKNEHNATTHHGPPFAPPLKYLYTIPEAARALGLSRTTIYALIAAGRLRRVKVDRRALVPWESLQAFYDALFDREEEVETHEE